MHWLKQVNFHNCRYPSYEQNPLYLEQGIEWERVRAPPTENLPHKTHVSDCLDDLHPGDHVEIQWRMSIGLPFGGCFRKANNVLLLELCKSFIILSL